MMIVMKMMVKIMMMMTMMMTMKMTSMQSISHGQSGNLVALYPIISSTISQSVRVEIMMMMLMLMMMVVVVVVVVVVMVVLMMVVVKMILMMTEKLANGHDVDSEILVHCKCKGQKCQLFIGKNYSLAKVQQCQLFPTNQVQTVQSNLIQFLPNLTFCKKSTKGLKAPKVNCTLSVKQ